VGSVSGFCIFPKGLMHEELDGSSPSRSGMSASYAHNAKAYLFGKPSLRDELLAVPFFEIHMLLVSVWIELEGSSSKKWAYVLFLSEVQSSFLGQLIARWIFVSPIRDVQIFSRGGLD